MVDDDPGMRFVLGRWLKEGGFLMKEADSAEAALDVLASEPADVVSCDIQMPGHGGIWLAGQIRDRYPATPVLLTTGVRSVPPSVSMRGGVVAYLVKPFDRERFMHAVQLATQWRHAGSDQQADDWLEALKDL